MTLISSIPDEILTKIFKYLKPKAITVCRAVCSKWLHVADYITKDENLWRYYCETYFSDICHSAYNASAPGLSWYNLYKSLKLWARLQNAKETIHQISVKSSHEQYFRGFQVLRDGVIGIVTANSIMYCNIDTFQVRQDFIIAKNEYVMYNETDDIILLLNTQNQLLVRKKGTKEIVQKFNNVYDFICIENIIYYVTNLDILFKYNLDDTSSTSIRLIQIEFSIVLLGHKNGVLHFMTSNLHIYSYTDNELNIVDFGFSIRDKLETLKIYNFINPKKIGREYTSWLYAGLFYLKEIDVKHIPNLIHIHGPVLFAAYDNCILRIFYSVYETSAFDLLKSKPLKEYHLIQLNGEHLYSYFCSSISRLDVVEGEESQTLVVAMPQKLVFIKFTYLFGSEWLIE